MPAISFENQAICKNTLGTDVPSEYFVLKAKVTEMGFSREI